MINLKGQRIEIREKRWTIGQVLKLYKQKEIIFSERVGSFGWKKRWENKAANIIEMIMMGLPLPDVYVSELQDGKSLVLDTESWLRALLAFLEGAISLGSMDLFPQLQNFSVQELEEENPRTTFQIYDHMVSVQMIDYMTSRGMQMQIGKHVERWTWSQEQSIRNIIYAGEAVDFLTHLAQDKNEISFPRWTLLRRQFFFLVVIMHWKLAHRNRLEAISDTQGLQQLFDSTMEYMETMCNAEAAALEKMIYEGSKILEEFFEGSLKNNYGRINRNIMTAELEMHELAYYYDVIWLCTEKKCPIMKNLHQWMERELSEKKPRTYDYQSLIQKYQEMERNLED